MEENTSGANTRRQAQITQVFEFMEVGLCRVQTQAQRKSLLAAHTVRCRRLKGEKRASQTNSLPPGSPGCPAYCQA